MTTLQVAGIGEVEVDRILSWRVWPKGREFPYLRIQVETEDGQVHANWYEYVNAEKSGDAGFNWIGNEKATEFEAAFGAAIALRKAAYQPGEDEGSQA